MKEQAVRTSVVDGQSPLIYLSSHYIQAKEYLEAIVASTSDAICTTDLRGRIIFFNPGAEKMLNVKARDVVGLPIHKLYERGKKEAREVMDLLMEHGNISNYETVMTVGDSRVHVSMAAALLRDRDGRLVGTLGISKDISDRVELERRLRELSITDNLTGLFNQRHLQERLVTEMQRARRQRDRLSMILIDLDRFKQVNDAQGHLEGDSVLRRVGQAIQGSIRGGVDSAYRYGGDEFIVLLPGMSLKKAEMIARRINENLVQDGKTVISFSYGIATLHPQDKPEDILHRADARMYQAKKIKKQQFPALKSPNSRS